ncbi:MAG: hydroxylamine reductase [Planctomycetota bacterium]|jgi:hydroxylamine reductase
MFCNQCEQTKRTPPDVGCTAEGNCGKTENTAHLQDLIIFASKGIAKYALLARARGVVDPEVDAFVPPLLFTTLTNVNFDDVALDAKLREAAAMRDRIKEKYEAAAGDGVERPKGPAAWKPAPDLTGMIRQGGQVSLANQRAHGDEDIAGTVQLMLYGLKGLAAYTTHAQVLEQRDEAVYTTIFEALDFLNSPTPTLDELVGWCMRLGEVNFKVMEMMDTGHTTAFGHPEPTEVSVSPRQGKALLVSGHELRDLEAVLKQTQGKGINIYTHGELLPANAYPEFKKYDHLAGNYGGGWQDQQSDFETFPGPILMTSNCIIEPQDGYKDRIFTTGAVGWPGVKHLEDRNFEPVVTAALAANGFEKNGEKQTITIGFGHNAVLGVAGTVIEAVKSGAIKHFYLIGGCDGAATERNYYDEIAEKVPNDSIILTLACGKYRFNKKQFGDINGIPRLLDIGQCNDSYSAVKIAQALADAFECGVNDLPLSLILSWFEQKAVVILLTLLKLGIKNIRLGPTLPAFVSPGVLNVLVEEFGMAPISTPEKDLQAIAAAKDA